MRMRVVLLLTLLPLTLPVLAACGAPAAQEPTPSPPISDPGQTSDAGPTLSPPAAESATPTPELSWSWIRTREYRDWESPPGWQRRRMTTSPHSEAKMIYIDRAIAETMGSGKLRFPAGATIVKEGYDAGGDLAIVAAMQRLPDRGWLFAEYRANGDIIAEGEDPPLCTQCHKGSQDGVLAFSLE